MRHLPPRLTQRASTFLSFSFESFPLPLPVRKTSNLTSSSIWWGERVPPGTTVMPPAADTIPSIRNPPSPARGWELMTPSLMQTRKQAAPSYKHPEKQATGAALTHHGPCTRERVGEGANIEHETSRVGRSTLLAPSPGTDLETLNKGNRVLASSLLQFDRALVRDRKGGDS